MTEPSSSSPPTAMAPMTLEPSPFASSADIPPGPATGYFLPGNPLPYLAPSATHQPELLLLASMLATLNTIVTDIQHRPVTPSHILLPSPTNRVYRLYLQLRNTLRHLRMTYAGAFASYSFYLAHQDRQAIIEWTHQLVSHLPPRTTSSPHHLCRL